MLIYILLQGRNHNIKNYYFNDTESSKIFITNYEIKDNNIIVYTGNGKKYSIPYTKENEDNILAKMKEQVICSPSFREDITKSTNNKRLKITLFLCGLLIISVAIGTGFSTLLPIIIGANVIAYTCTFTILIKQKNLLNDFKKHEFFLKNEEKLNSTDENDPNILINVSEKTKEIISEVPKEKPKFTINTIHKMKYQDLKEIIENIQICEAFGYNENNNSDINGWQKTNSK